jgi:hypothetical protein
MVNKEKATKFRDLLESELAELVLAPPLSNESEVEYTSRILCPALVEFVRNNFNSPKVLVRGDGSSKKPTPVSFLDSMFRPDLAVEQEGFKVWAGEVKVLHRAEISGVLAKAIGQSTIYSTHYLSSSVFLVVRDPVIPWPNQILKFNDSINIVLFQKFSY